MNCKESVKGTPRSARRGSNRTGGGGGGRGEHRESGEPRDGGGGGVGRGGGGGRSEPRDDGGLAEGEKSSQQRGPKYQRFVLKIQNKQRD